MALSKERWKIIDALLDQVLDQPTGEQRAYLKRACGSDSALFEEAKAFLKAESKVSDIVEQPAVSFAQTFLQSPFDKEFYNTDPGTAFNNICIGAYQLCEEIGRGGMGVVYRAERSPGEFKQQVAIKLLWTNNKSDAVTDRFKREQQTLASLTHSAIAQLYDGGITEDGHPYFIMEYVSGESIDLYCQKHGLDIDERLRLALEIIDAVSYAHKHLIVHRDLKPSNILVTKQGGIKLLDFGIAKLLDEQQDLGLTRTGEQLMTPGFAAPEQLQNKNITIGTDIYQLGLVIYELMTGKQPFRDRATSLAELIQLICEDEPTPPSGVLGRKDVFSSSSNDPEDRKADSLSTARRSRKLQGDLDAIILKMLKRQVDERYVSMDAVKADIVAYFDNRPVVAQKQSFSYRSAKYVRRHWRSFSVVSIFFIFLGVYAATVTYQSGEIREALARSELEKLKAERVSDFLTKVFKSADPNVAGLEVITADEILARGQQRIQSELSETPEIQTHMLTLLGDIYYWQGNYDKSATVLGEALSKFREQNTSGGLPLAHTLRLLASTLMKQGLYEKAGELLEASIAIHTSFNKDIALDDDYQLEYAKTLSSYGDLKSFLGYHDDAYTHLEQSIRILKTFNNGEHAELSNALNNLAILQRTRGQFKQATENMREAIRIQKTVLGERHTDYTVQLTNFAISLIEMEKYDEAAPYATRALELQKQILGDQHPFYIANTTRTLAMLSYYRGELTQAEHLMHQVISLRRNESPSKTLDDAFDYLWLGIVYQEQKRYDHAREYYEDMITIFRDFTQSGDLIGIGLCQIASLAYTRSHFGEAKRLYAEALNIMSQDSIRRTKAAVGYSQTLIALKAFDDIGDLLNDALKQRQGRYPTHHGNILEIQLLKALATFQNNPSNGNASTLQTRLAEASAHKAFRQGDRQIALRAAEQALATH